MTCIVGWASKDRMMMAADSLGASDWDHFSIRRDPKLFRLQQPQGPDVLVGFTTSYRMGQLLMGMKVPEDMLGDGFRYMVRVFVPEMRMVLKDGGWIEIKDSREAGGHVLVGYRGQLFEIHSDFQVSADSELVDAIGCGSSYAKGALAAWQKTDPELFVGSSLEFTLRQAIQIAARFSAVSGPIVFEEVVL